VKAVAQFVLVLGGAWCGAVLSQVFFHGESVRLVSVLAMWPVIGIWYLRLSDQQSRARVKAQLGFTLVWLLVLLFCGALALTDRVVFSPEGTLKRVLAVLAFFATLYELRRLKLELGAPLSEAEVVSATLAYPTTLPFASFEAALSSRATALGISRAELISRLETALAKEAPGFYRTPARFEVEYVPRLEVFALRAVLPGPDPQEELLFQVFYRFEEKSLAKEQDEKFASKTGFTTADKDFARVVDRVCREVMDLRMLGSLESLREDWVRMLNTGVFNVKRAGLEHALELVVSTKALPQPVGGLTVFDLTFTTPEGPKFNDFRAEPRALDTVLNVGGAPLHIGTVEWAAMPVSLLGKPDRVALEAWALKWLTPAKDGAGDVLASAIHKVELLEFSRGCELTVDFGSAPLAALEELVVLLRKSGEVSLDHAALQALAHRTHEGTRDDIVPLVRREGGSLSEHLVGDLWLTYAVESRQSFAGMSPHEAQGLGLDPRRLRALAVENLKKRLPPVRITGHEGVYMLTLPGEQGFFEASLLLLDDVWDVQLAPHLKGQPVVTMPFRDLVFVTGSEDVEGLERVRQLEADTQTQQLEYPLSRQFLVRRDGGWRVW
jgi:hypothetical protein